MACNKYHLHQVICYGNLKLLPECGLKCGKMACHFVCMYSPIMWVVTVTVS